MTSVLKNIAISVVVLGSMVSTGLALNSYVPWHYLGYLFKLIRLLIIPIDFVLDTDTLLVLITIVFIVESIIWTIRGVIGFINITGFNK